jgi:hypothetical protein
MKLTDEELAAAWRLAESNVRLVAGDRMWSRFQVQTAMQKVILADNAEMAQEVCWLALWRRSISEPLPGHDTPEPCVSPPAWIHTYTPGPSMPLTDPLPCFDQHSELLIDCVDEKHLSAGL